MSLDPDAVSYVVSIATFRSNVLPRITSHPLKMALVTEELEPTRCHLLFYCTSYRHNMFRALLCPSSGARDYNVDYHIGLFVLGLL